MICDRSRVRNPMSVVLPDAGPTGSVLTHLEGSLSGNTYDSESLMQLDPVDGRTLLARYNLDRASTAVTRETMSARLRGGLWRWRELLPVRTWDAVACEGREPEPHRVIQGPRDGGCGQPGR
jgi:hypothetical protein